MGVELVGLSCIGRQPMKVVQTRPQLADTMTFHVALTLRCFGVHSRLLGAGKA